MSYFNVSFSLGIEIKKKKLQTSHPLEDNGTFRESPRSVLTKFWSYLTVHVWRELLILIIAIFPILWYGLIGFQKEKRWFLSK